EPTLDLATPEQARQRQRIHSELAALEKERTGFDGYSLAKEEQWEKRLTPEARLQLPAALQATLHVPENGRSPRQKETLTTAYRQLDLVRHALGGLGDSFPYLAFAHVELALFRTGMDKRIAQLKRS